MQTLNSRPSCLENANRIWQHSPAFLSLDTFPFLFKSDFETHFQSPCISHIWAVQGWSLCRCLIHTSLSVLVKEVFEVLPSQTELKLLLQPLVLVPRCLCTPKVPPQPHNLPIAQTLVALHQIQKFWENFSTGERAEGFPQEAGGYRGLWAILGAAESCSVSPALHKAELDMKQGNVPHPDTVHHFLAALLWILPIFLHLRAQFNDWNWFLVLQWPCVGTRHIIFLLNTTLRALAHKHSSVHYNKVIPTFPSSP